MSSTSPSSQTTRGELSRQKLIDAAIEVFARHGYDGATTRLLAGTAGVNLGAIPYYFSSKEALYLQAADYLADQMAARLSLPLAELSRRAAHCQDKAELNALIVGFMVAQARVVLSGEVKPSWVQFFLRSESEPHAAARPLFDSVLAPARSEVKQLIGRLIEQPPEHLLSRTLTFMLFHQVLYFRLADAVLLRHLGWDALNPARLDDLLDVLATSLHAVLQAHTPAS